MKKFLPNWPLLLLLCCFSGIIGETKTAKPADVDVDDPKLKSKDLDAPDSCFAQIHIFQEPKDANKHLKGVPLELNGVSGVTDAKGEYRFKKLDCSGKAKLSVKASFGSPVGVKETVLVLNKEVELSLPADAKPDIPSPVEIRLVKWNGKPYTGEEVKTLLKGFPLIDPTIPQEKKRECMSPSDDGTKPFGTFQYTYDWNSSKGVLELRVMLAEAKFGFKKGDYTAFDYRNGEDVGDTNVFITKSDKCGGFNLPKNPSYTISGSGKEFSLKFKNKNDNTLIIYREHRIQLEFQLQTIAEGKPIGELTKNEFVQDEDTNLQLDSYSFKNGKHLLTYAYGEEINETFRIAIFPEYPDRKTEYQISVKSDKLVEIQEIKGKVLQKSPKDLILGVYGYPFSSETVYVVPMKNKLDPYAGKELEELLSDFPPAQENTNAKLQSACLYPGDKAGAVDNQYSFTYAWNKTLNLLQIKNNFYGKPVPFDNNKKHIDVKRYLNSNPVKCGGYQVKSDVFMIKSQGPKVFTFTADQTAANRIIIQRKPRIIFEVLDSSGKASIKALNLSVKIGDLVLKAEETAAGYMIIPPDLEASQDWEAVLETVKDIPGSDFKAGMQLYKGLISLKKNQKIQILLTPQVLYTINVAVKYGDQGGKKPILFMQKSEVEISSKAGVFTLKNFNDSERSSGRYRLTFSGPKMSANASVELLLFGSSASDLSKKTDLTVTAAGEVLHGGKKLESQDFLDIDINGRPLSKYHVYMLPIDEKGNPYSGEKLAAIKKELPLAASDQQCLVPGDSPQKSYGGRFIYMWEENLLKVEYKNTKGELIPLNTVPDDIYSPTDQEAKHEYWVASETGNKSKCNKYFLNETGFRIEDLGGENLKLRNTGTQTNELRIFKQNQTKLEIVVKRKDSGILVPGLELAIKTEEDLAELPVEGSKYAIDLSKVPKSTKGVYQIVLLGSVAGSSYQAGTVLKETDDLDLSAKSDLVFEVEIEDPKFTPKDLFIQMEPEYQKLIGGDPLSCFQVFDENKELIPIKKGFYEKQLPGFVMKFFENREPGKYSIKLSDECSSISFKQNNVKGIYLTYKLDKILNPESRTIQVESDKDGDNYRFEYEQDGKEVSSVHVYRFPSFFTVEPEVMFGVAELPQKIYFFMDTEQGKSYKISDSLQWEEGKTFALLVDDQETNFKFGFHLEYKDKKSLHDFINKPHDDYFYDTVKNPGISSYDPDNCRFSSPCKLKALLRPAILKDNFFVEVFLTENGKRTPLSYDDSNIRYAICASEEKKINCSFYFDSIFQDIGYDKEFSSLVKGEHNHFQFFMNTYKLKNQEEPIYIGIDLGNNWSTQLGGKVMQIDDAWQFVDGSNAIYVVKDSKGKLSVQVPAADGEEMKASIIANIKKATTLSFESEVNGITLVHQNGYAGCINKKKSVIEGPLGTSSGSEISDTEVAKEIVESMDPEAVKDFYEIMKGAGVSSIEFSRSFAYGGGFSHCDGRGFDITYTNGHVWSNEMNRPNGDVKPYKGSVQNPPAWAEKIYLAFLDNQDIANHNMGGTCKTDWLLSPWWLSTDCGSGISSAYTKGCRNATSEIKTGAETDGKTEKQIRSEHPKTEGQGQGWGHNNHFHVQMNGQHKGAGLNHYGRPVRPGCIGVLTNSNYMKLYPPKQEDVDSAYKITMAAIQCMNNTEASGFRPEIVKQWKSYVNSLFTNKVAFMGKGNFTNEFLIGNIEKADEAKKN